MLSEMFKARKGIWLSLEVCIRTGIPQEATKKKFHVGTTQQSDKKKKKKTFKNVMNSSDVRARTHTSC